MIEVGQPFPNITLQDMNGKPCNINDYKGKKVALYWYPKDFTPGCTKQACSLRDGYAALEEHNIILYGVSFDTPERHKEFIEKHKLPFGLLSDVDKSVSTEIGATKRFFRAILPKRATYLINEEGILVSIIKRPDVNDHANQIIKAFENA